ncbi:excinuclease ABC subunit UvrC [Mycoplasmopsis columboralis]|uniref:Excinuclease ABC subunit C n=1 Tax=Mycoplasmopsis columboralis TaxID=171282 RepID=A0A449B5Q0_9BACT|nr:excinuclease ABC subunit UvrC [Mycoplasmopsis columboralis]VEU75931.1 excinuclease ABC subunit C [Mycoplasmopsis columboralis]
MKISVKEKLKSVPKKPGIYLWKDQYDQIIYVGKALNLYSRMHQYFKGSINSYKTYKLVQNIADFDFYVTKTEKDALLLEKNYIEKYKPKYNILLLDDKNYSYIEIEHGDKLTIKTTHKIQHSKANTYYYGPITKGFHRRELVNILQRFFLYKDGLPILKSTKEENAQKFNQIIDILKLKDTSFLKQITTKMEQAAMQMHFEIAKEYRDSLRLLQEMKQRQISEISSLKNIDVFAFKLQENVMHVSIVNYRYGIQTSHNYTYFQSQSNIKEDIELTLANYYELNEIADNIVIDYEFKNLNIELLSEKITYPQKGVLLDLINLTNENNKIAIQTKYTHNLAKNQRNIESLNTLQSLLKLPNKIRLIYIFDNSNLNNTNVVGVGMAFKDGQNYAKLNRKFFLEKNSRFNTSKLADSEYMYLNVLSYINVNIEFFRNINYDDLFIVDGSIVQINSFFRAVKEFDFIDINKLNVIGLVKDDQHKTREIVLKNGTHLKIEDQNLYNFLSNLQIKIDAYAKKYFNYKFRQSSLTSKLSQIKGVGLKSEQKLLQHFKDYSSIYNASEAELAQVVGKKVAKLIKESI